MAPPSVRKRAPAASPNQVLAIVSVGICLADLDLFIVNVGLPAIGRDYAASNLEDLSWILNGYAIVYAALLVSSAGCGALSPGPQLFARNRPFHRRLGRLLGRQQR